MKNFKMIFFHINFIGFKKEFKHKICLSDQSEKSNLILFFIDVNQLIHSY